MTESIRLYIKAGNAGSDKISDVFESLSDLHRAYGGLGLNYRVIPKSEYSDSDKRVAESGLIPICATPNDSIDTLPQ